MSLAVEKIVFSKSIAILVALLCLVCLSRVHFATSQDIPDFEFSSGFDPDPVDPNDQHVCIYRSKPFIHAEVWKEDECSICLCNNGTTKCVFEYCMPNCQEHEQIKIEGECCKKCPFEMTISRVESLLSANDEITEGTYQEFEIDVSIQVQRSKTSRQVIGENLWKLSAWISRQFDGTGEKLSFSDNVLSIRQRNQTFLKPRYPPFDFKNVSVVSQQTDDVLCDDFKYLCVQFMMADNPLPQFKLPFTFRAQNNDETRLISCSPLPTCKGVVVRDFGWTIEADRAIPGVLDDVLIDLDVTFREDTRDLRGDSLWKVALFGSGNEDGNGQRFGEVDQILSPEEASYPLRNAKPLKFRDVQTRFDLGITGCIEEATHVCLEVSQSDQPSPDYTLQFLGLDGEISPKTSMIKCKQRRCGAKAIFQRLQPEITAPLNLLESTPGQRVQLNVTAISDKLRSTTVLGTKLWNMDAFFSGFEDGSGPRIDEQTEILTPTVQMVPLEKDRHLVLDDVMIEVDLSGLTCTDIPFMCVELRKNPSSSLDYIFGTNPEQDPFVGCLNMSNICRGVIAKNLDWKGDIPDFVDGEVEPVQTIVSNASVDVETVTNNLTGNNLWQMSVFASSTKLAGPDDILLPYFDQILTDEQSRQAIPEDGVLRFYNLETPPFQVDRMGCGKFKFLCYRFQKATHSDASFAFHGETGGKYVLNCQKLICKAVTPKRLEWTINSNNPVPGQRTPVRLDVTTKLRSDTRDINGTRLWRLGLYGSTSESGLGPKFDEVYQLLTDDLVGLAIENRKPLKFGTLSTEFEFGTIGCVNDVNYICLEFEKNDKPDPDYVILIEDKEGNDVKSLINCKKKLCEAKAVFEDLVPAYPVPFMIFEGKSDQEITVELDAITDKLESSNVAGNNLWEIGTFFSASENGDGERILEQGQILDRNDASKRLDQDQNLFFPQVEFSTDLSNHECSDIPFICYEIRKNPHSSINYNFLPNSTVDPIIGCSSTKDLCKGVIARFLTWSPKNDDNADRVIGEKSPITGDVIVDVVPSSRDLKGNDLWQLSTYASTDPTGTKKLTPVFRQVLNPAKASTPLSDGGPLVLQNVVTEPYPVDELGCGEAKYLCFELQKSNGSDVDFAFETTTGDDALIECIRQECENVFVTTLNWTMTEAESIPGQKTLVYLDVETDFQNRSKTVYGNNLWQVVLYASNSSIGDGERIEETNRVLSFDQAGQMIERPDSIILFERADALFDIGSVGCKYYSYICVEFKKGDYPTMNFSMIVVEDGELTPNTSLISCKKRECNAKAVFEDLLPAYPVPFTIFEGKSDQEITVELDAITNKLESSNVAGNNLWEIGTFFSASENGDGERILEQGQILDRNDASKRLDQDQNLFFPQVEFSTDLSNHECSDIPFICYEIRKNPHSSINYNFLPNSTVDPIIGCSSTKDLCKGVIARFLTWSPKNDDNADRVIGEKSPITGDVIVDVVPSSRDLKGNDLWQLSTYASTDPTGTKKLTPVFRQVLNPAKASTPLSDGGPLVLQNVVTEPYPVDELGCGEAKYLCFELQKSNGSDVDFAFETTTGDDALIECIRQKCENVFVTTLNWTMTEAESIPGQKTLVYLDVETDFQNRSKTVYGNNLWQVVLYASNSSIGDGERIEETNRVLSFDQAGQMIERPDSIILFERADALFDIGSVGCKYYSYICVEFKKGDYPTMNFSMIVVEDGELTPNTSLISCKKRECNAKVTFNELRVTLKTGSVVEGVEDQQIEFDVEGVPDMLKSTNIGGESLWKLKAFFSSNENGTDQIGNTLNNIIDRDQKNQPFVSGEDFLFDDLMLDVDLTSRLCQEVPYVCFQLEKDPASSINYGFNTVPQNEPLRECVYIKPICKGITASNFDWTVESPDLLTNIATPVSANLSVSFLPVERNLTGNNLWKVEFFTSVDKDGFIRKGPEFEQILDPTESSTKLSHKDDHIFLQDVQVPPINLFDLSCGPTPYLCMKLSKHDDSSTRFTFATITGEQSLVKCIRQECVLAVYPQQIFWSSDISPPTPGIRTPVKFNLSVQYDNSSTHLQGMDLWRVGIFGSDDDSGEGQRFKEMEDILSPETAKTPFSPDVPFLIEDIYTKFDIGSIGCYEGVTHLCLEFSRGLSPSPAFSFIPMQEGGGDSLVSCQKHPCISRVEFDDLIPVIHGPDRLVEHTNHQTVNVSLLGITDKNRTTLVLGDDLWTVNSFFSADSEGVGPRFSETNGILKDVHDGQDLRRGNNLSLDYIDFDANFEGKTCDQIPYMCFELKKNQMASINYKFEESITKCIDVSERCTGVVFNKLDFDVDISDDLMPGDAKNLKVDAVVNLTPHSPGMVGNGLWKVAVFPSADNNGRKRKGNFSEQLLMEYQAGTYLPPGGPLVINDVFTDEMDIRALGCSEFKYLCMEFSKGDFPQPRYTFRTESQESSLISCKHLQCKGM